MSNSTPTKIDVVDPTDILITEDVSVSFSYNDDGSINVEVNDGYGRIVSNVEVKLTINGITYSAITNDKGIANINLP